MYCRVTTINFCVIDQHNVAHGCEGCSLITLITFRSHLINKLGPLVCKLSSPVKASETFLRTSVKKLHQEEQETQETGYGEVQGRIRS